MHTYSRNERNQENKMSVPRNLGKFGRTSFFYKGVFIRYDYWSFLKSLQKCHTVCRLPFDILAMNACVTLQNRQTVYTPCFLQLLVLKSLSKMHL